MSHNIVDIIYEQARLRPASPAIISNERIITFRQLMIAVGITARHLRQNGVLPKQVVGISMGQNALHVITMLALAQLGAVSLPLHTAVPADRRALAARRFGAEYVVSGNSNMALPGLPFISLAGLSFDNASVAPDLDIFEVTPDSPFRIAISSGTSGDPKGMILTHRMMALRMAEADYGVTPASRTLPMDLNFIVGFRPALSALAKGSALVIPAAKPDVGLLHTLISHAVSHVYMSPLQAGKLVEPLISDGIHCPDLICLRIGGGPLPFETLQKVRHKITRNIFISYGSTESGLVSYATPEILEQHPSCVGRVCPWADVEIVNEDNHNELMPAGSTGLIRIRSGQQVSGWYLNDEKTRKHFQEGWYYPGDIGCFDESGLLYIKGRIDEQLNIGGLKVNPEDIEATLTELPVVVEAGVFVFNQADGCEEVAVAVVLNSNGTLEEIQNYARKKLGPLAPARYFAVSTLPRTMTGKLRRGELGEQFSNKPGKSI